MAPNRTGRQGRHTRVLIVFLTFSILAAVAGGAWVYLQTSSAFGQPTTSSLTPIASLTSTSTFTPTPTPTSTPTPTAGGGIGVSGGIGISDGRYPFDVARADGTYKQQAAAALSQGNIASAQSFWAQAMKVESNDAEAYIYAEDQSVIASGNPYITLVVATMLSGNADDINAGRENLQGAYIIQKEFNDGFKLGGKVLVRLWIASSGGVATDATKIARQIVLAASNDATIVGVMGWPFSGQTLAAFGVLKDAGIPMVSPTASSDDLTGKSSFFFRVCPSNNLQAIAGARYAEQHLKAKRVVLFVDPKNSYSQSLATGFSDQFQADQGLIVDTESYTVKKSDELPALLKHALTFKPDLIYFSGYASDIGVIMSNLPTSGTRPLLMGGDALYEIDAYNKNAQANYNRLRFTSFAFPDEWQVLKYPAPPFFGTYARTFDPSNAHPGTYGFSRPDADVMLSYDATFALLQASANALAQGVSPLTTSSLDQHLLTLNGAQAIQGLSGQIAFGNDSNPVAKTVVVLSVDANGFTQMVKNDIVGCFLKEQCDG